MKLLIAKRNIKHFFTKNNIYKVKNIYDNKGFIITTVINNNGTIHTLTEPFLTNNFIVLKSCDHKAIKVLFGDNGET